MQSFINFFAFFITFMLFALWGLPAFMMYHGGDGRWAMLYLLIGFITFMWGIVMWKKYFN